MMRKRIAAIAVVAGTLGIMIMVGLAAATIPYVQTAAAISDPNQRSATEFAPGVVKQLSKEQTSASSLAPRAIGDPDQIGDPNAIGDPHVRAPGLLKQGEELPGPE